MDEKKKLNVRINREYSVKNILSCVLNRPIYFLNTSKSIIIPMISIAADHIEKSDL
jgi:hypothetical protein